MIWNSEATSRTGWRRVKMDILLMIAVALAIGFGMAIVAAVVGDYYHLLPLMVAIALGILYVFG
jgi:uncharacterized BrkB/YihY/UPF0761 family membrane protein